MKKTDKCEEYNCGHERKHHSDNDDTRFCLVHGCQCMDFKKSHSQIEKVSSNTENVVRASEEYAKNTLSADIGKDKVVNSISSVPYTPLTKDDVEPIEIRVWGNDPQTGFEEEWVKYEKLVSALNGLREDIEQNQRVGKTIGYCFEIHPNRLIDKWFPVLKDLENEKK